MYPPYEIAQIWLPVYLPDPPGFRLRAMVRMNGALICRWVKTGEPEMQGSDETLNDKG